MAFTLDHSTKVITIYQADLEHVSGDLYRLDTDAFREELINYQDSEEGITILDTHRHTTPVTIAGVTYARFIEIINGYSLLFEDKTPNHYSIILAESNNNFFDAENGILAPTSNSVIANNSGGLIVASGGVSAGDITSIANAVWANIAAVTKQSITDIPDNVWLHADAVFVKKVLVNKKSLVKNVSTWELIIYDDDNTTPILNKELKDKDGNDITDFEAGIMTQEIANSV